MATHIVVDADHEHPLPGKKARRFGTDQSRGTCYQGDVHNSNRIEEPASGWPSAGLLGIHDSIEVSVVPHEIHYEGQGGFDIDSSADFHESARVFRQNFLDLFLRADIEDRNTI